MKLSCRAALCALLLSAATCQAAGLADPEMNAPQRLLEASLNQEVPANDPRLDKVREQIAKVMKASGESEQVVAQACIRNARHIFDSSRQRTSPLEVLDMLVKHAPAGKPLADTTQRYFKLRVHEKLDHAGALAQMAAGK